MRKSVENRREWIRWLWARGLPLAHIAFVLELELDQVNADLAANYHRPDGVAWPFTEPAADDARRRKVRNWTAIKIRRLAELQHAPADIADLLCLEAEAVASFLRRCRRLRVRRRDRLKDGDCIRARTHAEQRAAERARDRAQHRRRRRELAMPPAGWSYKDRTAAAAAEAEALARCIAAAREGRLGAGELLELAVGVHFAPPRLPEPAPWTGDTDPHFKGPRLLTAAQIAEAEALLRTGSSFPELAARYGCSVSTLRSYVDVGPLRGTMTWPTEPVRYAHGTVRWDRPLVRGRNVKVWVVCECGRERLIGANVVFRGDRIFSAQCLACLRAAPPCPPLPVGHILKPGENPGKTDHFGPWPICGLKVRRLKYGRVKYLSGKGTEVTLTPGP